MRKANPVTNLLDCWSTLSGQQQSTLHRHSGAVCDSLSRTVGHLATSLGETVLSVDGAMSSSCRLARKPIDGVKAITSMVQRQSAYEPQPQDCLWLHSQDAIRIATRPALIFQWCRLQELTAPIRVCIISAKRPCSSQPEVLVSRVMLSQNSQVLPLQRSTSISFRVTNSLLLIKVDARSSRLPALADIVALSKILETKR